MLKRLFLVFCLLGSGLCLSAQGVQWTEELSKILKEETYFIESFGVPQFTADLYDLTSNYQGKSLSAEETIFSHKTTKDPLGIFCNLDFNLDQKLPFRLRFRLGEYHYTHQLEYGLPDLPSNQIE